MAVFRAEDWAHQAFPLQKVLQYFEPAPPFGMQPFNFSSLGRSLGTKTLWKWQEVEAVGLAWDRVVVSNLQLLHF